jgi:hypothetical protein
MSASRASSLVQQQQQQTQQTQWQQQHEQQQEDRLAEVTWCQLMYIALQQPRVHHIQRMLLNSKLLSMRR